MESLTGIIVSIVAGLLTGTFMWPMKVIKKLKFEHLPILLKLQALQLLIMIYYQSLYCLNP